MHGRTAAELKAALGAEVRRLRAEHGLSQQELANKTGYSSSRGLLSSIENGRELPSEQRAAALDDCLGAGGHIRRLRAQAWAQEKIERVGPVLGPAGGPGILGEPSQGAGGVEGVEGTNRREVIQAAGGLTAAEAVAALADRVATADPTPLTLAEIGAAVQWASEANWVVPHAELRARLEPEHLAVEALLDRRLSRRTRDELTLYAGQYCYELAWLAYNTGDDLASRAYLTMARHHAAETQDPLLAGSVATLHAGLAGLGGNHAAAADIAGQHARTPGAHPYAIPVLAATEARNAALLGQPERARAALADMEARIWRGSLLPGPDPLDEEAAHANLASVLAELRDGEAAEGHARTSLRLLAGAGNAYFAGTTYNALGRAFLRRSQPDPEQAAAATAQALAVTESQPNRGIVGKADRTWRDLAGRWGTLPAVRDLGEQVAATRKTLPA